MRKRSLFLFFLLLQICHTQPSSSAITHSPRLDGFGSQFQNIISTVFYAESTNQKYVYTPFQTMAHNYANQPNFLKKKETLINFISNFEVDSQNTANQHPDCRNFVDQNIVNFSQSASLKKIKQVFRKNKNVKNYFDPQYLNIAMHIRRNNSHDNRPSKTSEDTHLQIIDKLKKNYKSQNPRFHIYSQGESKNFKRFNDPSTIFHLNKSIEDTFTSMVLADILITDFSSFSYTAAWLSEGTVYYMPFWHKPFPQWIILNCPK